MNRRSFLRTSATAIPGAVALQMLGGGTWVMAQNADFADDVDVLNYALTLEFLESEFYRQGNAANILEDQDEAGYLKQIGADEDAHVQAISKTITSLGGTPAPKPTVDFADSFASRQKYLTTAHTFENLGVSAYLGAAGFIKSKEILQAAAGIFGVEARHAAVVGSILGLPAEDGVYMGATETPKPKAEVLAAARPFIRS